MGKKQSKLEKTQKGESNVQKRIKIKAAKNAVLKKLDYKEKIDYLNDKTNANFNF